MVPLLERAGEPVLVMNVNPTAENIARLICQAAADLGFPVVEVRLWETAKCFATYRPSPGEADRVQWKLSAPGSGG